MIYLLEPVPALLSQMPYDKTHMVLVAAESEQRARQLANAKRHSGDDDIGMWENPEMTTCRELDPKSDCVIESFGWGSA